MTWVYEEGAIRSLEGFNWGYDGADWENQLRAGGFHTVLERVGDEFGFSYEHHTRDNKIEVSHPYKHLVCFSDGDEIWSILVLDLPELVGLLSLLTPIIQGHLLSILSDPENLFNLLCDLLELKGARL
jgi:hypothetical protein